MTLDQFLVLQQEMIDAFGWLIRWWLIMFAVAGILAAALVAILTATARMLDES